MNLHATSFLLAFALLPMPVALMAQDDALQVPAQDGRTAPVPANVPGASAMAGSPAAPGAVPTLQPGVIMPESAAVELNTAAQPFQASLPAGVCPVITDYLFQQCQQNAADPMCAPPGAN